MVLSKGRRERLQAYVPLAGDVKLGVAMFHEGSYLLLVSLGHHDRRASEDDTTNSSVWVIGHKSTEHDMLGWGLGRCPSVRGDQT